MDLGVKVDDGGIKMSNLVGKSSIMFLQLSTSSLTSLQLVLQTSILSFELMNPASKLMYLFAKSGALLLKMVIGIREGLDFKLQTSDPCISSIQIAVKLRHLSG